MGTHSISLQNIPFQNDHARAHKGLKISAVFCIAGENLMTGALVYLIKGHKGWDCQLPNRACRNPGSNQGPLDLQSNALPTELFRPANIVALNMYIFQGASPALL